MTALVIANPTLSITAQKANVSYAFLDSSFKYAAIPIAKDLRAICQLIPSQEIQDGFCYANVSVVQYISAFTLAPILSSRQIFERQFRDHDVRIFDSVVEARTVDVTVILSSSSSVRKWTKSVSSLDDAIRSILYIFVVAHSSFVIVPASIGRKNDIAFICVNATGSRKSACRITASTAINIEEIVSLNKFERRCTNECVKVVGLSRQLKFLNSIYNANLKSKKKADSTGFNCIQKVLIIGPPGCGKTSLVNSFAKSKKCGLITIEASQLSHITPGESENVLCSLFEEAVNRSKEGDDDICIVHLDQVENLCRKSRSAASHLKRISSHLFKILEVINEAPGVIVIATTSDVHSLDPLLRRSSRIQVEIYIGMPNEKERQEILQIHNSNLKTSVCKKIAACTVGYNGADLAFLVQNVNRSLNQNWNRAQSDADVLESFNTCMRTQTPSAMRGGLGVVRLRSMQMNQLGGCDDVKSILKRYIEWPLKYSTKFKKLGVPVPKGLLLYGPPGCAKTSLVCAIANTTNTVFLAVSAAELYSPYVGEAERNVVDLFQKARMNSPCILFIDEIDALVGNRAESSKSVQTKILSAFLTEMDGFDNKIDWSSKSIVIEDKEQESKETEENNNTVIVVAATNRPDKLDSALLRPGRLDKLIYVEAPDKESRLDILRTIVRHSKIPLAKCVDLNEVADKTDNFTGADLKSLMKEAAYVTLFKEGMSATHITREHILESLGAVKPSVLKKYLEEFENFAAPK